MQGVVMLLKIYSMNTLAFIIADEIRSGQRHDALIDA